MDQGIAIVIGAVIGASVSGIVAYFTSRSNLKAVKLSFIAQSNALQADLERTTKEIQAKFDIEVTAQSKQEWIDTFRGNVANLISSIFRIYSYSIDFNKETTENISEFSDLVYTFYFYKKYIELMLTGKDDEFNQLINIMDATLIKVSNIGTALSELYLPSSDSDDVKFKNYRDKKKKLMYEIQENIDEITIISKKILKNEYTSKENLKEWGS